VYFFSILICTLAVVYPARQTAMPTVVVFPASVNAATGENFTINVTMSYVADLYGWELRLGWNATLLDAVDAVEGPFLKARGETYFTYKLNQTEGRMIADCTLLGSASGVDGSGTLGMLSFFVKNAGECPLDLYSVLLLDSFEQPIPCQVDGGYGYFVSHDVAITSVDVLPTAVIQGESVNITVGVENQGSFFEVFNVTVFANLQTIGVQSVSLSNYSSSIVIFFWNTTGFNKGQYDVSASASILLGEVDTADNSELADCRVTILCSGHDVTIITVAPFKTAVGHGYSMFIVVTVGNYGTFSEIFDVTVAANGTAIQTRTISLSSGNSSDLVFAWETATFAKGKYAVSAFALPVPEEIVTSDNSLQAIEAVKVTVPGDISGDFGVGPADFAMLSSAYGSTPSKPNWIPNADIDNSEKVGPLDFAILSVHYGQRYP